jgi:glycosyltransferase involved in cell wall biosynthesis
VKAGSREVTSPPAVTAIIPCYNRERFVGMAIESVLAQTYPNIQLIVVDDGSTDRSRQVLEQYKGRLLLLEHPGGENRGQSASINLGLAHAVGKYVGILDSDDIWMPSKIAEQVAYLEANPDCGLVYGNGEAIDESGRRLYAMYGPGHEELNDPKRVLLDCYFLVPNNSLVRKRVLDEVGGFDEALRAAQDHDMAIRIAEVTKLGYLDRLWFKYRRHADSISKRRAELRWRNGFLIVDKAAARGRYDRSTLRKRRGVLHFRLGQCYLETRQPTAAASHFLQALLSDPSRALRVLMRRERVTSPH